MTNLVYAVRLWVSSRSKWLNILLYPKLVRYIVVIDCYISRYNWTVIVTIALRERELLPNRSYIFL